MIDSMDDLPLTSDRVCVIRLAVPSSLKSRFGVPYVWMLLHPNVSGGPGMLSMPFVCGIRSQTAGAHPPPATGNNNNGHVDSKRSSDESKGKEMLFIVGRVSETITSPYVTTVYHTFDQMLEGALIPRVERRKRQPSLGIVTL
jgi:hypothetical protein